MSDCKLVRCGDGDAPALLEIVNEIIATSTAFYDYEPRTLDTMRGWLADRAAGKFPVIGAKNSRGELLGFSSYGPFRARPAYKYSVEHTVCVDQRFRGQGVGRILLREAIVAATAQNYHMMIGGIDAENAASIELHRKLGFTSCGSIKHAGFKFGRWLDLEFYQLILPTPANPVDG